MSAMTEAAPRYCVACGQQVIYLTDHAVHRTTGNDACQRSRFGDQDFTEQAEQDVLVEALALLTWFRSHPVPLNLPPAYVRLLDRADALLEVYDPGR